jgi:hypothetical protein
MFPANANISIPAGIPQLVRDLVHERTGIFFENDRLDTLIDKLLPRALVNGCASFLDYYYTLKYEENNQDEWLRVMDAFSVQETYFYREYAQIQTLVDVLVPAWFRQTAGPASNLERGLRQWRGTLQPRHRPTRSGLGPPPDRNSRQRRERSRAAAGTRGGVPGKIVSLIPTASPKRLL